MTFRLRPFLVSLVLLGAVVALQVANDFGFRQLGGPVSEAEARLGRPATPVSVAGAGRRTVRRCAAGVYDC